MHDTESEPTPGTLLLRLRTSGPLVHNITNYVAMNVTANVLLAAGASPAMIHAREEAADFAAIASALTINIGTLSPAWVEAMLDAAAAANRVGTPWVLDPVAAGATDYRREVAARLLAARPGIVRGNASEIIALAGGGSGGGEGRGVDSTDGVASAEAAAGAIACEHGCVVAVTGEEDFITDGERTAHITNGHALMPRVTALGCSLSALVAAFAAVHADRFRSTVAALAFYGVAGERAAATDSVRGPGSFAVAFLDALAGVDAETLDARARITSRAPRT